MSFVMITHDVTSPLQAHKVRSNTELPPLLQQLSLVRHEEGRVSTPDDLTRCQTGIHYTGSPSTCNSTLMEEVSTPSSMGLPSSSYITVTPLVL